MHPSPSFAQLSKYIHDFFLARKRSALTCVRNVGSEEGVTGPALHPLGTGSMPPGRTDRYRLSWRYGLGATVASISVCVWGSMSGFFESSPSPHTSVTSVPGSL